MIMLLLVMYVVRASNVIKRQVPMVLSLVGLSQKAKMYPNELSGGEQQQRVIFSSCYCK